MIVSAINGVYQYSGVAQSRLFPMSLNVDKINDLMKKYGINQTGDEYKDMQALFEAMYNDASLYAAEQAQGQNSAVGIKNLNAQNPPWAPLMAEVGVEALGSLALDYSAFTNKINSLRQASSISQDEKIHLQELSDEAPYVFVEQKNEQDKLPQASGADILAMMNKMFLLNR